MVKAHDCSLADLVTTLQQLPPDQLTLDRVTPILSERPLRESSFARFVNFRADKYARNLVFRCDHFEMLVLCWEIGRAHV